MYNSMHVCGTPDAPTCTQPYFPWFHTFTTLLALAARCSPLRHSLAQIRATSCPSTSNPHTLISNPRHLAGNGWFPSSPFPSMAVHTNLVSAIPAWCSDPLHLPQCQELLLSSLHTQLCSSPLPARCWWVPLWQKQHLSSAACLGRGRDSVRVGLAQW